MSYKNHSSSLRILACDLHIDTLSSIEQGIERMIELTSRVNTPRASTELPPESVTVSGEESAPDSLQEKGFEQLLSDQGGEVGLLEQLTPEGGLEQEDILLQGGTELPEAADVATDASILLEPTMLIPQAGTAVVGVPTVGFLPRSQAPLTSSDAAQRLVTAASSEPDTSEFKEAVAAGGKGRMGTKLVQSLITEKIFPAPASQIAGIDPALLSDGEKRAFTDNRLDAFATSLGRISGEGGITTRAVTAPMASLSLPPGQNGWSQELGERVLWMVGRSIQSASLRITPPHMGPIEIQVAMQHDQVQVAFSTHQGAVKEALEASIPRLREMFGENNLQLVNVDVGQRKEGDSRSMDENFMGQSETGDSGRAPSGAAAGAEGETVGSGIERSYQSNGLLDYFA